MPSTATTAPVERAMPGPVAEVFATYPADIARALRSLRSLILDTAAQLDGVGEITETLKWGEPAYLTEQSKSGSTIRIGFKSTLPDEVALYFNCQTTLVDTFRTRFPELRYQGNRAVTFAVTQPLPEATVRECIALALTYHRNKKQRARRA